MKDLGLAGHWVSLEPLSPLNRPELERLELARALVPQMGGPHPLEPVPRCFGPSMAIRANATGEVVGVIENGEMRGYPGVAVLVIFVDESRARPGCALEAYALYVHRLFRFGARLVHLEVLSFNRAVLGLLRKVGVPVQVRLREHVYAAGRFWDLLVFAFDEADWERQVARFRPRLPGGGRVPAALGGSSKGAPAQAAEDPAGLL